MYVVTKAVNDKDRQWLQPLNLTLRPRTHCTRFLRAREFLLLIPAWQIGAATVHKRLMPASCKTHLAKLEYLKLAATRAVCLSHYWVHRQEN